MWCEAHCKCTKCTKTETYDEWNDEHVLGTVRDSAAAPSGRARRQLGQQGTLAPDAGLDRAKA